MSCRVAIRVALAATLLLTAGCGGGAAKPPRSTRGPAPDSRPRIRFEDLPVTRLSRARVPLPNAANPSAGAPKAPVVIQLWSDFECPYCVEVHPALKQTLQVYAGKVRLVWRDYPLPFHPHARLAANAGREAYAQGGSSAFFEFHDAVYDAVEPELDASALSRFAAQVGLDEARFHAALLSLRHDAEISQDVNAGDAIGVTGTPAFLINDYFFVGAVPFDILRVVVDRALSDAGA